MGDGKYAIYTREIPPTIGSYTQRYVGTKRDVTYGAYARVYLQRHKRHARRLVRDLHARNISYD